MRMEAIAAAAVLAAALLVAPSPHPRHETPASGEDAQRAPAEPAPGHVALASKSLRAVIADNSDFAPVHRAGYSGVAELVHGDAARNLFVPAVSGLNFEHIFSGDAASYGQDIFEPRRAAMTLHRTGERRVELRQERTLSWPLRTTIAYELAGDDAIDFTITCIPLADAWKKHGYIGLFFASYIDRPEDMAIHFIGRPRARKGADDGGAQASEPRWIRHLSPEHGKSACHRPAGSDWDPPMDPGFPIVLASGHSDLEYVHPFYYGVSHGKVLVMMFDPPEKDAETRFAQSPSGGGEGNPAWDFLFLRRRYEVGKEFSFRARAVYREFSGRDDVVRAYESWSGRKVERPR